MKAMGVAYVKLRVSVCQDSGWGRTNWSTTKDSVGTVLSVQQDPL